MYKQIHPIDPPSGKNLPPQTLRLDTIQNVRPVGELTMLNTDIDEYPYYVSDEEGKEISKALLKLNGDALAREVSDLTHAVRDLWQLLRARMH